MSGLEQPSRRARRRPSRGRRWLRPLAVAVLVLLGFAVGVALGMALEERPVPGGEQTIVRTLEPVTQRTASP